MQPVPLPSFRAMAAQGARRLHPDTRHDLLAFLDARRNADGGFRGRSAASDIYYTAFALECLAALAATPPPPGPAPTFLPAHVQSPPRDLISLSCLIRCLRLSSEPIPTSLVARIETFRTPDGGYNLDPGMPAGSATAAFLAVLAWLDAGGDTPAWRRIAASLGALRTPDGAFGNVPGSAHGAMPPTTAALALLAHLHADPMPDPSRWLLSMACPGGGFRAAPLAPAPDLLSTALALHALHLLETPIAPIAGACTDFIDDCRSPDGGFGAHPGDPEADTEYAFHALLALGCLAP